MRTVLLVPRRKDHGPRDDAWQWCRDRWEKYLPDVEVVEGYHDEGPFSRSAAVNRASRLAGAWDLGIVIDADVFLPIVQVRAAIDRAAETGRVTWAHRRWRGLHQDWSERIVRDRRDFGDDPRVATDMDILVERTNPISWSCCVVFPRAVFDDLGGFDERFVGWGYEDMALQSAVAGLYGHERVEGDVYHLWHPRVFGAGRAAKAHGEYTIEAVRNARLGRRYMVALRRDYALHDRSDLPTSEDERKRDIANLVRDDAKLAPLAEKLGLPDWSDYWPTLEELRDQAREWNRLHSEPSVTLVVHTGGELEKWPERSAYLRQSLDSLDAMVSGNIVQRVVYSDWPEELRGELDEIARSHGAYIVGGDHVGYTESMRRQWQYLSRRALGDYIFRVEDDFTYERPVDLSAMVEILRSDPKLVQLALLRDACYADEIETGGILGWPEPAFTRVGENGTSRLEHRLFFTANPSVFRKSLTTRPWPRGKSSERLFGDALIVDPTVRFAFAGSGENWIRHIGQVRAGTGY